MEKFYNSVKIEVGIDEAGRGCLAGPVFTGAVILPKVFQLKKNNIKSLSVTRFKKIIKSEKSNVARIY